MSFIILACNYIFQHRWIWSKLCVNQIWLLVFAPDISNIKFQCYRIKFFTHLSFQYLRNLFHVVIYLFILIFIVIFLYLFCKGFKKRFENLKNTINLIFIAGILKFVLNNWISNRHWKLPLVTKQYCRSYGGLKPKVVYFHGL